jgi:asparagine synthase (glutamine-hydrolysing)
MCGIAGLYNLNSALTPSELQQLAQRMSDSLQHRGPDDAGLWLSEDGCCVLAHRRLSVVDTSQGGHQPMKSPDGADVLCFNGEIYNFVELKQRAINQGRHFHSSSDTEVLLDALQCQGTEALTYLDGMFAFGWYQCKNRHLLLARDLFGEKPLYFTCQHGLFAFASELQALTVLPGFDPLITAGHIASLLAFQQVPAPYTVYAHCYKLEPGHFLRITPEGVGKSHAFTQWQPAPQQGNGSAEQLEDILLRSTKRRLIADVPVGAFLSGGVDSSTVVALMRKVLQRPVQTFSIGFTDMPESEHLEARAMAQHLDTEHQDLMIDPADYAGYANLMAACLDEPNCDSSCVPTYFISQLARQKVTVALTGDGGDELFGGYSRYLELKQKATGREADMAARRWHLGREYYSFMGQLFPDHYLRDLFGSVPALASDQLLACRRALDLDQRAVIHRVRAADARYYLPVVLAKVDRMSMQHALECRTPYLCPELAEFAAGLDEQALLADGRGKYLLRQVAQQYIPQEWLNRPKKGFGIDPFMQKAKGPIWHELKRRIDLGGMALDGVLGPGTLKQLSHQILPTWSVYHLWSLLLLELWLESHPYRWPVVQNPAHVLGVS